MPIAELAVAAAMMTGKAVTVTATTKAIVAGTVVTALGTGAAVAMARAGVVNKVEKGLTNAEFSNMPYRQQMAFIKTWATNDEYDTMVRACVDKNTLLKAGVKLIDGAQRVVCCMPMCENTKNPVICENGHGTCESCDETSILFRVMSVFDRQYTEENLIPPDGLARTSLRAAWIRIRDGLGKGGEHTKDDPKCPYCRGRYLERDGRPRVAIAQKETNGEGEY